MFIKAQQRFIRTSPRKLRLVVDSIRSVRLPQQVLVYLEQTNKAAARIILKVLKQAMANAVNNLKLPADNLFIKEIQVGAGPTYKRGRPVSRGRLHAIAKRTSHVTVVLESKEEKGKRKNGPES